MFRIAEEYIKTIKQNLDEKYFFVLKKMDFQIFKIFKNRKFEKKSEKLKFEKIKIFKIICENSSIFFLQILIFRIFLEILIFENFENFEILKINFLQDEKIFFVRIFFYCLNIFFRNAKHVFRAPMIPSERCYSA